MGHIVAADELENLDKEDCDTHTIPSASSASSTPPPHSHSSSTPPSHTHHSPTYPTSKSRRFQNYVGITWSECVQNVCALLPSAYADWWLRCMVQMLHNEGPLPESWRIYIAILALCRHEVTWAVRALTFEFISADGDRKWLSGLRFAPNKLRALTPINNILAHRPWLLTSQHILDLTKGEESWSFSELCQALCLLTHFHSFASFLHSCLPLPPPPSLPLSSHSPPLPSHSNSLPHTPRTSPAKTLLPSSLPETLKHLKAPLEAPKPSAGGNTNNKKNAEGPESATAVPTIAPPPGSPTKTQSEDVPPSNGATSGGIAIPPSPSIPIAVPQLSKSPEEQNGVKVCGTPVGGAKREIQTSPQPNKQSKNETWSPRSKLPCKEETPFSLREFPHLCQDLAFTYEDYMWHSSSNVFKILEFNWQDHGYCLMTRLLNEMGNLIDERFGAMKSITHQAWNRNDDNSYHYRKAVWNYIQSLYGIRHEAYMYSQIDSYLSPEIKVFIKMCCCSPETLKGKIPAQLSASSENLPAQLVPLSIIIMEARTESGLLYALRAIIPHLC